ncbi:MAG: DVUA0089 family protein, partial [Gammaproteobacteria bacterium]
ILAFARIASAADPVYPCVDDPNDPDFNPNCYKENENNNTIAQTEALGLNVIFPVSLGPGDSVTVDGEIDSPTDIDFYKIVLTDATAGLYDIDFADDVCLPSADPSTCLDNDAGLDAFLSVFSEDGTLLAYNDDSDFFTLDPGSDPNGDYDPFLGSLLLASGTYYVVVSDYVNDPDALDQLNPNSVNFNPNAFEVGLDSGFQVFDLTPDSSFGDLLGDTEGPYQLTISVSEVPVPAAIWLFASGLIGLAGMGFRKSKQG